MPTLVHRVGRGLLGALGVNYPLRGTEWRMEAALKRAAARTPIRSIIDVGASDGSWSRLARKSWPEATFLLIEANEAHREALEASGFDHIVAAAGDKPGNVHFKLGNLYEGVASHEPTGPGDIVVPMITIDDAAQDRRLAGPYLIKLDTHGFEREILAGSDRTLELSELLVIEAYNIELMPGALRFHQLCAYLEDRGFRPLDLADPIHRPKDGLLWQFDLIFGRATDPRLSDNAYN